MKQGSLKIIAARVGRLAQHSELNVCKHSHVVKTTDELLMKPWRLKLSETPLLIWRTIVGS